MCLQGSSLFVVWVNEFHIFMKNIIYQLSKCCYRRRKNYKVTFLNYWVINVELVSRCWNSIRNAFRIDNLFMEVTSDRYRDFIFAFPLFFFPHSIPLRNLFFLCVFLVLFQYYCSNAQVIGRTLVHEFPIF